MAEDPKIPDTFDDDLKAITHWVGDVTAPDPWLLSSAAPTTAAPVGNDRPAWQRALAVAASIVVVLVGVLVLTRGQGGQQSRPSATTSPSPSTASTPSTTDPAVPTTVVGAPGVGEWLPTSQSPLSPRNEAQGVWTGNDVIVFGGTTQPACPTCDYASYGDSLHDGAIYNPATDTWRAMAPLPDEASYVGQSVADSGGIWYYSLFHPDVQASTQTYRLWYYSLGDDTWTEVNLPTPVPNAAALTVRQRTGALLLYSTTDEFDGAPDWSLDTSTMQWTQLPNDPFDASFNRQMLDVNGSLLLFGKLISTVNDSTKPALVQAARLDDSTQAWTTLTTLSQLSTPWFAAGLLAIAPVGGGSDGGQVNNWGVTVPSGGIYDSGSDTWSPLPAPVPDDAIGAVGRVETDPSFYGSTSGSVLDLSNNTWLHLPTLPDGLEHESGQTTVAAGRNAFTFGGTTGFSPTDPVHNRSYMWRPPAPTPDLGTGQDALDAALTDLGIVLDKAPADLFVLGPGVFCGYEKNGLLGNEDLNEPARRCFRDALHDKKAAMFITQRTSDEGGPIATVWVTVNRVTTQYEDFTRDPFGSGTWSTTACTQMSFIDSTTHLEFNCEHNQPSTVVPITLIPVGGCGAATFAAINADQTVSLNVYLKYGNSIGITDDTFTVPEPQAIVELRRGLNLGEGICNDVIATMRVERKSDAVAGTLHLTTSPVAGKPVGPTACGSLTGLLAISGLEFADGTKVGDLLITTTGLNCFAG